MANVFLQTKSIQAEAQLKLTRRTLFGMIAACFAPMRKVFVREPQTLGRKLSGFVLAPGSLTGLAAMERKLMLLQLSRAGVIDHWTLLEALGIPDVGRSDG